jgi:hypothetical protein
MLCIQFNFAEETFARITNAVIPVYKECHIHPKLDTTPEVIRRKLTIHPVDPCMRGAHDVVEWIDPQGEDRRGELVEKASDLEEEEENQVWYDEYRRLVEEDEEQERRKLEGKRISIVKEKVVEGEPVETININETVEPESSSSEKEEVLTPLAELPEDADLGDRRRKEANALIHTCESFLECLVTTTVKDELREEVLGKMQRLADFVAAYNELRKPKNKVEEEEVLPLESTTAEVDVGGLEGSSGADESMAKVGSVRGSKTQGSMVRGSQLTGTKSGKEERPSQRPSQIAKGLRLRKKKSLIKKILYHVQVDLTTQMIFFYIQNSCINHRCNSLVGNMVKKNRSHFPIAVLLTTLI